MSKWQRWSKEELGELGRLIRAGFTNPEIAEKMNRPITAVSIKGFRIFGGNPSYRRRITTHKHLREPVMRYFLTHSAEQTQKKFKLTKSEFKSILTVSYKMSELNHLRKDTRRHDPWSARELRFLLMHAGLVPRDFIGRALNRGSPICVQERLQKLGLSSRTLNGITLTQFQAAFGFRPKLTINTQAGPGRNGMPTCFKIIPWVWLNEEFKTKRLRAPKPFRQLVSAMSMFQDWIYQGGTLAKMKRIARKAME